MADLRESVRAQFLASADNYQTAHISPEDARVIADLLKIDGSTSDGFHTFDELYRHRSYHYPAEAWDLFPIPEREIPAEFDGHTPKDVVQRLRDFLRG